MTNTISNFMTKQPHSIRPNEKLSTARHMMKEYNIRHLPVIEDFKVVGLVTDRDFALVGLYPDMDMSKSTVEDLMIQGILTCRPTDEISTVTAQMAETKSGSVIVVDADETLLGIFTAIDALKLVSQTFK